MGYLLTRFLDDYESKVHPDYVEGQAATVGALRPSVSKGNRVRVGLGFE